MPKKPRTRRRCFSTFEFLGRRLHDSVLTKRENLSSKADECTLQSDDISLAVYDESSKRSERISRAGKLSDRIDNSFGSFDFNNFENENDVEVTSMIDYFGEDNDQRATSKMLETSNVNDVVKGSIRGPLDPSASSKKDLDSDKEPIVTSRLNSFRGFMKDNSRFSSILHKEFPDTATSQRVDADNRSSMMSRLLSNDSERPKTSFLPNNISDTSEKILEIVDGLSEAVQILSNKSMNDHKIPNDNLQLTKDELERNPNKDTMSTFDNPKKSKKDHRRNSSRDSKNSVDNPEFGKEKLRRISYRTSEKGQDNLERENQKLQKNSSRVSQDYRPLINNEEELKNLRMSENDTIGRRFSLRLDPTKSDESCGSKRCETLSACKDTLKCIPLQVILDYVKDHLPPSMSDVDQPFQPNKRVSFENGNQRLSSNDVKGSSKTLPDSGIPNSRLKRFAVTLDDEYADNVDDYERDKLNFKKVNFAAGNCFCCSSYTKRVAINPTEKSSEHTCVSDGDGERTLPYDHGYPIPVSININDYGCCVSECTVNDRPLCARQSTNKKTENDKKVVLKNKVDDDDSAELEKICQKYLKPNEHSPVQLSVPSLHYLNKFPTIVNNGNCDERVSAFRIENEDTNSVNPKSVIGGSFMNTNYRATRFDYNICGSNNADRHCYGSRNNICSHTHRFPFSFSNSKCPGLYSNSIGSDASNHRATNQYYKKDYSESIIPTVDRCAMRKKEKPKTIHGSGVDETSGRKILKTVRQEMNHGRLSKSLMDMTSLNRCTILSYENLDVKGKGPRVKSNDHNLSSNNSSENTPFRVYKPFYWSQMFLCDPKIFSGPFILGENSSCKKEMKIEKSEKGCALKVDGDVAVANGYSLEEISTKESKFESIEENTTNEGISQTVRSTVVNDKNFHSPFQIMETASRFTKSGLKIVHLVHSVHEENSLCVRNNPAITVYQVKQWNNENMRLKVGKLRFLEENYETSSMEELSQSCWNVRPINTTPLANERCSYFESSVTEPIFSNRQSIIPDREVVDDSKEIPKKDHSKCEYRLSVATQTLNVGRCSSSFWETSSSSLLSCTLSEDIYSLDSYPLYRFYDC